MNRSHITSTVGSSVPLEPAEVALNGVGWSRVGLLRRLVKVEREADSSAATARAAQIPATEQRRAA
jgi:hypothetical protein